jgi:EAL domain-containing protein (putative c-di-GMP-specific phosphodiesterase class I)
MTSSPALLRLRQALNGWWRQRKKIAPTQVMALLADKSLRTVFQPLVELHSGAIVGHEALVRAPLNLGEMSVARLLRAAQDEHCQKNFELACVERALEHWVSTGPRGQLFINLSAQTLLQLHHADLVGMLLERFRKYGVSPRRLGIDLTGFAHVKDLDLLVAALRPLRTAGVMVALDDFKASNTGMQVWAKVLPNIVKLSPRWTRGIGTDTDKANAVRSLVRLTQKHSSLLLAKGVESASELHALQALGVNWAQGFFLGSPDAAPVNHLNARARAVLTAPLLTVPAPTGPAANEARAVAAPAAIPQWWDSKC